MGTQVFTTSESGTFRFPAVPPGSGYLITVEMPGFKTLKRGDITVNVGKTVMIKIQLERAALEEEVTVIAPSPTVDVTSSKVSITYSQELLLNIPLARDFYDVIKTAPGIISEENPAHRTYSSHGSTVRSNQAALDGVNITDPFVMTNRVGFSFDAFEEIELEVGAHPAEVGMTDGAYVNIVTKSGGNELHGMANFYFFTEGMVKSLIPEAEAEAVGLTGPSGMKTFGDYNLSLGGPIIRDRLWFFVNGRYINWKLSHETIPSGAFDLTHDELNTFVKLTLQPLPSFKLTGMCSFGNIDEPILASMPPLPYWEKTAWVSVDNQRDLTILGMINWVADQNTFFDIRFNYLANWWPWRVHPDADPYLPTTIDLYTNIVTGSVYLGNQDADVFRLQLMASGTRFVDNFLGGNHEIKAGVEYEESDSRYQNYKQSPYFMTLTFTGLPWGLHFLVLYMGMFYVANYGEKPRDTVSQSRLRRFSLFFQDSFTIKKRINLNLGMRYDESHGDLLGGTHKPLGAKDPFLVALAPSVFKETTIPDMKDVMKWKDLSPRIGLVFDVFGDAKTSLKASWSRYNEYLGLVYFHGQHPFMFNTVETLWFDLNENGIIEDSDFFLPTYLPPDPSDFNPLDVINPKVKGSLADEFIVGLEKEIYKDFSASISFIQKIKTRMPQVVEKFRGSTPESEWWIPYSVTDPGWDGEYGTTDDKEITVYGVKAGAPESRGYLTNIDDKVKTERKYREVELTLAKRMSNRWQLLGSITWSKFEGNIEADYGGSIAEALGNFSTPNYLVNRYGRLNFDRRLVIKLQGSVLMPWEVMMSAFYLYSSGEPWTRTLEIQLPYDSSFEYPGTLVTVNGDPAGSYRKRSRNNLDIRVEKSFKVGKFGRLWIFLDVLNVLGEHWFDVNQDPGGRVLNDGSFQRWPTYGQFTAAHGLRTLKLSARFIF